MRASLSTWIKLAAAVASLPVDLIHAFMNPPTGSCTLLTLKNRQFHLQSQIEGNNQSYQLYPNVTPLPSSSPIPFGIKLTGGPKLNGDGYTGKGIKVAVIDSGIVDSRGIVDSGIVDDSRFNGKVKTITTAKRIRRKSEESEESENVVFVEDSISYHGTHLAGTIHMMAPDAEIYDYCVFKEVDKTSEQASPGVDKIKDDTADANIKAAIHDAINRGCDIINLSFARNIPNTKPEYLIDIEEKVRTNGVIVVCAAGTGDGGSSADGNYFPEYPVEQQQTIEERNTENIYYPAYSDETISIASCRRDNDSPGNLLVPFFQSVSPQNLLVPSDKSASNGRVDFAGIGEDVVSFKPKGKWMKASGTSYAASHVTGFIAALLDKEQSEEKNYYECLDDGPNETRKNKLVETLKDKFVIDIRSDGRDNETGEGFLTYLSETEFQEAILNFEEGGRTPDESEKNEYWPPMGTIIVNSFNGTELLGPPEPYQPHVPGPDKPSDK